MARLNFWKKKQACCCGNNVSAEGMAKAEAAKAEGARVKILGAGCAKCAQLEANIKLALEQLGMEVRIDHVMDFTQISAYGVMTTPALVLDGVVVSLGKVLKTDEVVEILQQARR